MKLAFLRVIVVFLIVVGTGLYNLTNKRIKKGDNAVLIELFTSQGCSSCPPADKLLKELAENHPEGNVYVLSYHVDYWDRLGWKDIFSQKKFTEKQYSYAKAFKLSTVYTPQAIVNGDT
ncbi:MAG: DUF1223 domain-containing protein, partial [Leeuwenhoekiella sp.]